MFTSALEMQELRQMRHNIRRGVLALELCWSCQCICDGNAVVLGDGPAVWLCAVCADQLGTPAPAGEQRMLPAPARLKTKAGTA